MAPQRVPYIQRAARLPYSSTCLQSASEGAKCSHESLYVRNDVMRPNVPRSGGIRVQFSDTARVARRRRILLHATGRGTAPRSFPPFTCRMTLLPCFCVQHGLHSSTGQKHPHPLPAECPGYSARSAPPVNSTQASAQGWRAEAAETSAVRRHTLDDDALPLSAHHVPVRVNLQRGAGDSKK